jgi:hypothetical protein
MHNHYLLPGLAHLLIIQPFLLAQLPHLVTEQPNLLSTQLVQFAVHTTLPSGFLPYLLVVQSLLLTVNVQPISLFFSMSNIPISLIQRVTNSLYWQNRD